MEWVAPVCEYIMARLPKDERGGFNDQAMTAWQFGCMLLEACGYAEKRPWGAALIARPRVPGRLPIPEDVATVVLAIAGQRNELSWRQADGMPLTRRPTQAAGAMWTVVQAQPPKIPPPTVVAGRGFGSAWFSDAVQELLEILGLVCSGTWTAHARPVLLREQPAAWAMNVLETDVFQGGLEACIATLPEDVKEAILAISRSAPEAWVEGRVASHRVWHETRAAEACAHGVELKAPDAAEMRRKLRASWPSLQTHEVENLFYARWRLTLGWDSQAAGLLPLFHDKLANQMVTAVIKEMT